MPHWELGALRRHLPTLENHFTVVTWDQRGSGPPPYESMFPYETALSLEDAVYPYDHTGNSEGDGQMSENLLVEEYSLIDQVHVLGAIIDTLAAWTGEADLPEPLAAYVVRSGAVGKPRVTSFRADIHGRIRSGPDAAWMPFTGTQVNTYGERPSRAFIIDATRSGLPITVLHLYDHTNATMRAKVLALATVVDASGSEMHRSETVTVFNDLVVLAPGAIIDAPVHWTGIDANHVRGVFTAGDQSVSAVLTFNAKHDLVDFVSRDRSRASADGRSFDKQTWSTPLTAFHELGGYRLPSMGEGRWNAPKPEGEFT